MDEGGVMEKELDPLPYLSPVYAWPRFYFQHYGYIFSPRPEYSQDEQDYI